VEREKILLKGLLCLDVITRSNSTYKMLEGTEKCESAFVLMKEFDRDFAPTLNGEKQGKKGL
jgi:hypothetical protein